MKATTNIRILFILFTFTLVQLQLNAKAPSCIITHYSTHDGLSHSGVMCMHEDKTGFMWFGTWDGLNKFDGYTFTTFKSHPGDTNSLSHNRVDEIKEDKWGNLWVKTYDDKVHRFDQSKEKFSTFPYPNQSPVNAEIHITSYYLSPEGDVWLLTGNAGCFRIELDDAGNTGKVQQFKAGSVEPYKIPSNNVLFIYQDKKQNIWISTDKGLRLVSNQQNTSAQNVELFNEEAFTAVFETENNIWLGTSTGDIVCYTIESDKRSEFQLPKAFSISTFLALTENEILIGTKGNGLYLLNRQENTFNHYSSDKYPEIADNSIRSLYKDTHGVVWIENDAAGVVRFFPEKDNFKRFFQKTENVSPFVYYGDFFKVFEDVHNRLWINLKKGGFCYYNREDDVIEYFYNKPGSPDKKFSNLVTSLHSDRFGNLWLSTHSRGIEKISFINDKFRHFTPDEQGTSLSANDVRCVYEDSANHLWVSTKEGKLYCYKNHKLLKIYDGKSTLNNDIRFDGMIYCIMQDTEGALWFGTKGNGIIKADYQGNPDHLKFKLTTFSHDHANTNSLSHNWVYSILEDKKGDIWVGTYGGGLNLLEKKKGHYEIKNHLNAQFKYPFTECNQIRYLQLDKDQNLWIASTNGLVIMPSTNTYGKYLFIQREAGNKNGLANNDVHFILRDKDNTMWVSAFGGGLGKVDHFDFEKGQIQFTNYNTSSGLPIDIVLSMLEDDMGNIWLSTENGISKFNIANETFTNFSAVDGLKSLLFSEASCCKCANGEFNFGSLNGFYSFFPNEIMAEYKQPELTLVNLQLFNRDVRVNDKSSILNKSILVTDSIELRYNQSVFSIEYAGLFFRNPENIEYAFKLENFEKDWNYVRNQRKATYTNLPSGEYTFKVMCSLTGKFDDSNYKTLHIKVLPPPWKSTWAYGIYILLLIGLFLAIRYTVIRIISLKHKVILEHQITDLKLRFFTNISHELRTPLSLIMGPVDELLRSDKLHQQSREYLRVIDKNAKRMLNHVNNLLDFRKVQTGKMKIKLSQVEMVSFIRQLFENLEKTAQLKKIDFTFQTNLNELVVWADSEKVDTIVFNLLSNAFKYTPENKKIEIRLSVISEDEYSITIQDEGKGIKTDDLPHIFDRFRASSTNDDFINKSSGIGLSLSKDLTDLMKGRLQVNSTYGNGSSFEVILKRGKDHFKESEFEIHEATEFTHSGDYIVENELHEEISLIEEPSKIDKNISVLLVEDNADLRNYIYNTLRSKYNVFHAANGLEGLEKARDIIPDMIISDIMMPEMDGIQFINELRNDLNTSHIPIILLTAKSSLESEIEGLKYGADAYITKPFKMEYLLIRIVNLLNQRKLLKDKYFQTNDLKVVDLSPDQVIVTARDEEFLKNVIKTIEENIANTDFNIEHIANSVGLGRTTFFKKMKSLTGMAPVEFLKDIKLKRGYQLLESGEYTVSEIAFKTGFSDAGYFTKCFKEKYNTTPTRIIKKEQDT